MEKVFDWDDAKNAKLREERGVSFEAVVSQIEQGELFAIVEGQGKYSHQRQYVLVMDNYVYVVPFVESAEKIFLKTIMPSRKLTKRYLTGEL
ncbi:MAG TPA: BrnT family toxin [Candidatus Omnitrophota bacterium]|nr:BrnT family toxin [Candidatus Omnitrophota bacterium]